MLGPTEFIDVWRRASTIAGFSTDRAESMLLYCASMVARGPVVEVGSFVGRSTCFLALGVLARDDPSKVYAVDPYAGGTGDPGSQPADALDVLPFFELNLSRAGVMEVVTPLRGDAAQVAMTWEGAHIGLLFIGGLHTLDGVIADFSAFEPHLAPDAILVFDDYSPPEFPGVRHAVDLIAQRRQQHVFRVNRYAVLGTPGYSITSAAARESRRKRG